MKFKINEKGQAVAGKTQLIDKKAFEIVDNNGNRYINSNKFKLYVGISQPDSRSIELLKITPLEYEISINNSIVN